MSEESPEKIEQQWFDSVRTDYYHQMQAINDIVLKARVLLSFLAAASVPIFVVVQGVETPLERHEVITLMFAVVTLAYGIVAAYYLCRAFLGVQYKQIPQMEPLKNIAKNKAQKVKWLEQHYRECADFNRGSNKRRMRSLDKGANHLFMTVFLVLLLVLQSEFIRLMEIPMPDEPESANPASEESSEHQEPASPTDNPDQNTDSSPFENDSFTRSDDPIDRTERPSTPLTRK